MKKDSRNEGVSDMRPEYDFSKMEGGVRGKYAERFRAGTNLVLLDPDVAEVFGDDASVNEALRSIIKASH